MNNTQTSSIILYDKEGRPWGVVLLKEKEYKPYLLKTFTFEEWEELSKMLKQSDEKE